MIPVAALLMVACSHRALADGKMFAPRSYNGSIEEKSQEAIIIFHASDVEGEATEDLILKIQVETTGGAGISAVESLGWVVPFPHKPTVREEDAALFKEAFDYVQARRRTRSAHKGVKSDEAAPAADGRAGVTVLSREVVGSYDVAVVRTDEAGSLNRWLEQEGFQALDEGEETIEFYRKKGYVFACMKVSDAELAAGRSVDLHPLRFTFKTGGRDGIYFPMKMSALQEKPFDVNLYVFYGKWINDDRSPFGFEHRGFELVYRDWDSSACESDAGKAWSSPEDDVFLRNYAHRMPTLKKLFQKLHPGEKYYLTNLRARRVNPSDLRDWPGDLWLFPHYTDPKFVPFDVRGGGPASLAYPHVKMDAGTGSVDTDDVGSCPAGRMGWPVVIAVICALVAIFAFRRSRGGGGCCGPSEAG